MNSHKTSEIIVRRTMSKLRNEIINADARGANRVNPIIAHVLCDSLSKHRVNIDESRLNDDLLYGLKLFCNIDRVCDLASKPFTHDGSHTAFIENLKRDRELCNRAIISRLKSQIENQPFILPQDLRVYNRLSNLKYASSLESQVSFDPFDAAYSRDIEQLPIKSAISADDSIVDIDAFKAVAYRDVVTYFFEKTYDSKTAIECLQNAKSKINHAIRTFNSDHGDRIASGSLDDATLHVLTWLYSMLIIESESIELFGQQIKFIQRHPALDVKDKKMRDIIRAASMDPVNKYDAVVMTSIRDDMSVMVSANMRVWLV